MIKFKVIIAVVTLIVTLVLVFNRLFASQPIQIVLESGEEVTTEGENYFTLSEVLFLIFSSFLAGVSVTYLFYQEALTEIVQSLKSKPNQDYSMIIPLLKGSERDVFILLKEGVFLQNDLVLRTGMSKVKITRVLASLERKNLIVKERYGLTNRIKIKL